MKRVAWLSAFIMVFAINSVNAQQWHWDRSNTLLNPSRIEFNSPCSPFLYDVDGDHDLDLIIGQGDGTNQQREGSIKLYYNDGYPEVQAWRLDTTYFSGLHFNYWPSPTLGDIDGDDSLELVVSFKFSTYDSVIVFRNRGTPSVPIWRELPGYFALHLQGAPRISEQRFIDWDNDGDKDLIINGILNIPWPFHRSIFYRNTGSAGNPYWVFDSALTVALPILSTWYIYGGFDAADFNNDGINDFALTYIGAPPVFYAGIFINHGSNAAPLFNANPAFQILLPSEDDVTMIAGDVDNDRDIDIIAGGYSAPTLTFAKNYGNPENPNFRFHGNEYLSNFYVHGGSDFTFFDRDNDGDLDLAMHNIRWAIDSLYSEWSTYLDWTTFENNGTSLAPSLSETDSLPPIGRFMRGENGMTSGDLNGDNFKDIVYSHFDLLGGLVNRLSGQFDTLNAPFASLDDSARFYYPELVDLNSDSKLDLIVYDHRDSELTCFENTGTPQTPEWTSRPDWLSGLNLNEAFTNACDLNRDHLPDLVLLVNGHLNAYLNIGSPSVPSFRYEPAVMAELQDLTFDYYWDYYDIADLDGDGSDDIIINDNGKFVFIDNQTVLGIDSDNAPAQNEPNPFNYPNPFGASGTSIKLELKSQSSVDITVYDIGGRLIRAFPSKYLPSGYNNINWDGKDNDGHDVRSGIYFYKVMVDGQPPRVRKMTILR